MLLTSLDLSASDNTLLQKVVTYVVNLKILYKYTVGSIGLRFLLEAKLKLGLTSSEVVLRGEWGKVILLMAALPPKLYLCVRTMLQATQAKKKRPWCLGGVKTWG